MSRSKAVSAGLLAGLVAGLTMTATMLLLGCFGVATPLTIIGDRLSVFIPPGPFLSIMGRVGGYNHLKQIGIGSTMGGQLLVAMLGGALFGLLDRKADARLSAFTTVTLFVGLPMIVFAVGLWPVLGTNYSGLPIAAARLVTLIGFALCVIVYERAVVVAFRFITEPVPP